MIKADPDLSESGSEKESEEEEEQEEMEEMEEDNSQSSGEEESPAMDDGHPFPTPPPDNMPMDANAAAKKTSMKYGTILTKALSAIEAMPSRSGCSVQAIVKYMKSNGFEGSDELRLSKLVLKNLKVAVSRGDLEQVKRSFKLSAAAKNKSKALEKMKLKQAKAKEKLKQKEMKEKETAETKAKSSAKAKKTTTTTTGKKSTMKASERKTKAPSKKAKKDKETAAATATVEEDVDEAEMPDDKPKKAAKTKVNAAQKKKTGDSESSSKAKPQTVRKSIGTLAPQVGKKKVAAKKVKMVVAAKTSEPIANDEGDSEFTDSAPTDVSTPIRPVKQKAARKVK